MAKFAAIFMIVVLLAFIGYKQFNGGPRDERSAIAQAIAVTKKDKPLKLEEEALLQLQLAIIDFSSRSGNPPNGLQDLVPTYFDTVPIDPVSGKDFPYVREGKSYRLGLQVETASSGSSGEAGSGTESGDGSASGSRKQVALLADDADFVNPNTLQDDTFVYNATGKRDPFMPIDNRPPEPPPCATPLECIDMGELRFTGVISKPTGEKMAMVEDARGHGYYLSIGTKIGLNRGEVVDIQDALFKVLETSVDIAGRVQQTVVEKKKISANEDVKKSKVKGSMVTGLKAPLRK